MTSSLPIDIDSNQLLDWLIDRRHCRRNYQTELNKIREAVTNAAKLLPHEERVSLEANDTLTYYHMQDLFTRLLQSEASDKSLFGSYNSPLLAAWQAVLKSYERDNLFLAEAAMVLTRLQVYELPNVKRQLVKARNTQNEMHKKIEEYTKKSEDSLTQYHVACRKYGVSGVDLRAELTGMLDSALTDAFSLAAETTRELADQCSAYAEMAQKNTPDSGDTATLKVLKYIIANGNTSVYEFETGRQLDSANIRAELTETTATSEDAEIDWGDEPVGSTTDSAIDWGSTTDSGIDWGSTTESGAIDVIEVIDPNEAVTSSNSHLSIMHNQTTRLQLIQNLQELLCFLKVRKLEISNSANSIEMNHSSSKESQSSSTDTVQAISLAIQTANDVIDKLTNQRTRDMILMLQESSHVEKVISQLSQKRHLAAKLAQKAESCRSVLTETSAEETKLRPFKDRFVQESEYIQSRIEKSVSLLYDNRSVSVILNA